MPPAYGGCFAEKFVKTEVEGVSGGNRADKRALSDDGRASSKEGDVATVKQRIRRGKSVKTRIVRSWRDHVYSRVGENKQARLCPGWGIDGQSSREEVLRSPIVCGGEEAESRIGPQDRSKTDKDS